MLVANQNSLSKLRTIMDKKKIILYERYDGVRFVLERSLLKSKQNIQIHSTHWKREVKDLIDKHNVDLLITEINKADPIGLEISHYARKTMPNLKIIWITVQSCSVFKSIKEKIGDVHCIEKPLEIRDFRQDVFEALELSR